MAPATAKVVSTSPRTATTQGVPNILHQRATLNSFHQMGAPGRWAKGVRLALVAQMREG